MTEQCQGQGFCWSLSLGYQMLAEVLTILSAFEAERVKKWEDTSQLHLPLV